MDSQWICNGFAMDLQWICAGDKTSIKKGMPSIPFLNLADFTE
jgi:hypothetical protein